MKIRFLLAKQKNVFFENPFQVVRWGKYYSGKSQKKNPENHVFLCFFIIFLKRFSLDNTIYYFIKFNEITTNVALEIHWTYLN